MTKFLIINGPNINLLHLRDKNIYGDSSLETIENECSQLAKELNIKVEFRQSNSEGGIVEEIQQAIGKFDGIIINAGGYSHTSVAIRDALEIFDGKKLELHISNIYKRESFRHNSLLSQICDAQISGLGTDGYSIALLAINDMVKKGK